MAPISDVSGDGRSDVVVCSEDYFVRCFNGNAHGTGDVLWEHEIYSGPVYSDKGLDVVQDIDGDGFDDFVIGTTGGARLIRMLSGKTGNTIWTYHTNQVGDGGWVYQVDGSQDFTGDGVADVLACAGDDGTDTGPRKSIAEALHRCQHDRTRITWLEKNTRRIGFHRHDAHVMDGTIVVQCLSFRYRFTGGSADIII